MPQKLTTYFFKNWLVILGLVAILALGNNLRNFSYAKVPHPGETADEYSYGWLGISILKEGKLKSWSTLSPYVNRSLEKVNVDTIYAADPMRLAFPIVEPWFDHPPFFGLISGGFAYAKGIMSFEDASVGILRRPFLKIAWVTTLLIFFLGVRLFGKKEGLLAALLYSIIPTAVISSRLAMMENAYTPLFLAVVLFAHIYLEKKTKKWWIMACVFAFFGMLIKLWAGSIVLALILIALFLGKKNKVFMIISAVVSGVAALLVFAGIGFFVDWDMFVKILLSNSERVYGASSEVIFQAILTSRITTYKYLTDGWIFASWIALLTLIIGKVRANKSILFLSLCVFSYLAIFVFFGSESYGWYKFPFYPFLIIALAKVLIDLYKKPNLLPMIILFSLPIGTGVHRLIGVEALQKYVGLIRLTVLFCISLMGLLALNKKIGVKVYRVFFALVFIFAIFLSIKQIYYYTYDTWFFAN